MDTTTQLSTEVTHIGKYDILEFVGSGGLAKVYKAQNPHSGEIVALKRLHDKYQTDRKLLGLFHKEIMIHSQVSHKNCVNFIEADLTPPNAHFVTEYIDGPNLYVLIKQVKVVPPIVACAIVFDLLKGLEHLHCLDIVHSDMTPSNVIIETTGRAVLADFGLSCNKDFENYAGQIVGTPGYQAPERVSHAPITHLADIYGAGIIMYELLSGERLYKDISGNILLKKMKNIDYNWLSTGNEVLDENIRSIVAKALAFNPEKRYETPFKFMEDLYLKCLKVFKVSYTRRAVLQWMVDVQLSSYAKEKPEQRIYV